MPIPCPHCSSKKTSGYPRYNKLVGDYIAANNKRNKVTIKDLLRHFYPWNQTQVVNTDAWKEYQETNKRQRKSRAKEVPLSAEAMASIADASTEAPEASLNRDDIYWSVLMNASSTETKAALHKAKREGRWDSLSQRLQSSFDGGEVNPDVLVLAAEQWLDGHAQED